MNLAIFSNFSKKCRFFIKRAPSARENPIFGGLRPPKVGVPPHPRELSTAKVLKKIGHLAVCGVLVDMEAEKSIHWKKWS